MASALEAKQAQSPVFGAAVSVARTHFQLLLRLRMKWLPETVSWKTDPPLLNWQETFPPSVPLHSPKMTKRRQDDQEIHKYNDVAFDSVQQQQMQEAHRRVIISQHRPI